MGFHKVVTTLWLFLVVQTVSIPLKKFIQPSDIELANRPLIDDRLLIDKTNLAKELCEHVGGRYFFVRPRRFGKSTFLETLHAIFNGRGLYILNGTYIHKSNYLWNLYPVLYLDFGKSKEISCHNVMLRNQTRFQSNMALTLKKFQEKHHLMKKNYTEVVDEFSSVLTEMKDEKKMTTVILIDEYDLPILSNVEDCPAAELINKANVEAIFQVLKTDARCIQFAFVTGVSQSVFRSFISPPDLIDITNCPEFHDIAGITDFDLNTTYTDYIANIAKRRNENNVTGLLKGWYDGYQFADGINPNSRLYSPLSVHSYFQNGGVAKSYYDEKGHAKFLLNQIIRRPYEFSGLNLETGVESDLKGGNTLDCTPAEILLYDAGYLTIANNATKNGKYLLRFPNREMRETFHKDIADAAIFAKNSTQPEIAIIGASLKKKIPEFHNFMKAVNIALMKLGMRPQYEKYYHFELRSFMDQAKIIHTDVETPIKTNDFGNREPDITGYDEHTCFLFEIKYERRPREAYEQVHKSIKAFLDDEKLCGGNKNLLAAGITFTSDVTKDVVKAYQAKLFAPNGTVLETYQSLELKEENGTVFSSDDFFCKITE